MKIAIQTFAVLGDYIDNDTVIEIESGTSVEAILEQLKMDYPKAAPILESCRVVIGEDFVENTTIINSDTAIFLLPPSSGG